MVVTRRQQGAPSPASRTNSAQPIPRVKGKVPAAAPDVSSPLANGTTGAQPESGLEAKDGSPESPSKKGKGKGKGKNRKGKEKSKKGTSFTDLCARIFLLWFTIYTLSVCPNDDSLKSPICRGLYTYRKLVLEPYVVPTFQHALAHPSVAPYVDRARPVIDRTITIAKPIALRTYSEWTNRVVPQWNKRIVPQYRKHVVPQLKKHLWPHVERVEQVVSPYIGRVQTEYATKVDPTARVVVSTLHRWQHKARPYVVLAAHKTYDGYQTAKPYAIPLLQKLQALLIQLVQILGEQRRQFVDPHLKKIWERVNELGNGETTPLAQARNTFSSAAFKASASVSSVISSATQTASNVVPEASEGVVGSASPILPDVVSESESLPAVSPSTNPAATLKDFTSDSDSQPTAVISSIVASVTEEAVPVVSAVGSSITEKLASTASSLASAGSSVVVDKVAPSASSIAHGSIVVPASSLAAQLSSSASSLNDEASSTVSHATKSVASAAPEVLSTASSVIDEFVSTLSSSAAAVVPTGSVDTEDDFDIASLLGLDEEESPKVEETGETADPAQATTGAGYPKLTDEEIAEKRAKIVARHDKWEAELNALVEKQEAVVRDTLESLRKVAAAELREPKEIHQEVEGLVSDAEKYLKGAEKYLGTLNKETRPLDDKKAMWDRVAEKIGTKFNERLTQVESVVNGWYLRIVQNELAEVQRLTAEVKDFGENAQGDLGLDYAWLEDVTVKDWQRYHDLARVHERFTEKMIALQDGTHPEAPANPILPVLQELQDEVQDVVVGFETRLRRIKRNGERAFGTTPDDAITREPHETSPDETVSILPIEEEKRAVDGDSPAVPPVVIGRNKEEILSALDRAAEQGAKATSAPGAKSTSPEEVVQSLAQDAEAEVPRTPAVHEEL